jgi:hypothetical protein
MDDVPNRWVKIERWRGHRITGFARAYGGAGLGQARPGRSMIGAVNTAASKQRLVGCGDDRVNVFPGDVAHHDLDHGHGQIVAHPHAPSFPAPSPHLQHRTVRGRSGSSGRRSTAPLAGRGPGPLAAVDRLYVVDP